MPKFRTMRIGTPAVATHLLADPGRHLTPVGGLLRKTSRDELPIPVKVGFDEYYLKNRTLLLDLKIILLIDKATSSWLSTIRQHDEQ